MLKERRLKELQHLMLTTKQSQIIATHEIKENVNSMKKIMSE